MAAPGPIRTYVLTSHAKWEIERRGLDIAVIDRVIRNPEQRLVLRSDRVICQSRWTPHGQDRVYLVRVVVDVRRSPAEVVTAYRTTKIRKYWSSDQ